MKKVLGAIWEFAVLGILLLAFGLLLWTIVFAVLMSTAYLLQVFVNGS